MKAGGLTLTGDRLLGLAALAVTAGLAATARLQWTSIHTALAVFVGVQVLTSLFNTPTWPSGLKFVTVYVLGFACFCLAAEWARGAEGQRRLGTWWIVLGAGLGLTGALLAAWANVAQQLVWGSGIASGHWVGPPYLLFAATATFGEWNLLSSFLLIPFALALWRWPSETHPRWLTASLGAMTLGLAFGLTRAAWVSMAGIIVCWWWVRRPRWRQMAALAAMLSLAALAQSVATSDLLPRYLHWPREPKMSQEELRRHLSGVRGSRDRLEAERRQLQADAEQAGRPQTGAWAERIGQLTDQIKVRDRAIKDIEAVLPSDPGAASGPRPLGVSSRLLEPIKTGADETIIGRVSISRATIESWGRRPVVGHGAGSVNRLAVVLPDGQRLEKVWNGNLLLFVLHDSGLVGLAALLGLAIVVWRRGARAIRHARDGVGPSLAVPLLVVGTALCFAYQFTHALWLMYPYVYLGFLTGATDDAPSRR